VILLVFLAASSGHRRSRAASVMLGLAVLSAATAASGFGGEMRFVHEESVRNWFAINLDQGFAALQRGVRRAIRAQGPKVEDLRNAATGATDIILVVVESLSSYHSPCSEGGTGSRNSMRSLAAMPGSPISMPTASPLITALSRCCRGRTRCRR